MRGVTLLSLSVSPSPLVGEGWGEGNVGGVFMEEESFQRTSREGGHNPQKPSSDGRARTQKAWGWSVWFLIFLILFLLVSSLANLVASHWAYESSRNQVKAIDQLNQSIKAMQRSVAHLSNMIEQSPQEDEESEEDSSRAPAGDGSI